MHLRAKDGEFAFKDNFDVLIPVSLFATHECWREEFHGVLYQFPLHMKNRQN